MVVRERELCQEGPVVREVEEEVERHDEGAVSRKERRRSAFFHFTTADEEAEVREGAEEVAPEESAGIQESQSQSSRRSLRSTTLRARKERPVRGRKTAQVEVMNIYTSLNNLFLY